MLDYRTRPPASPLSADERRLIDEAIAAGKVTYCPTGAMATAVEWVWQPNPTEGGKLVQVGGPDLHWKAQKKSGVTRVNAAASKQVAARRAAILPLLLAGANSHQVARQFGVDPKTISSDAKAMIADGRLPADYCFPRQRV